jgi:hypothetical protein
MERIYNKRQQICKLNVNKCDGGDWTVENSRLSGFRFA